MSCKAENSMQLLKHTDACHLRIYIKCLVESDETKYNIFFGSDSTKHFIKMQTFQAYVCLKSCIVFSALHGMVLVLLN